MKALLNLAIGLFITTTASAQTFKFDFTDNKHLPSDFIRVTGNDRYSEQKGYGYDLQPSPVKGSHAPFFFSIDVPDGNYKVTALIGNKHNAGETCLRGESRRLFFESQKTRKGEYKTCTFTINKRNKHISTTEDVRIKPREQHKLNWDDKLTFEFNGSRPVISQLIIERTNQVPTLFLCGNSTVVDQDNEPWASWGQMITRFFTDQISIANYAESGERADTFIDAGRLKKALTQMKPGDYIFMEFGHNDQKLKGPGKGAFYSFMTCLKTFIDEARARQVIPILITPTQRRSFGTDGKIRDTHEDYPEAMRWLATKENVPLIDLNEMTRTFYEAMGPEDSKRAFVHYPAGSYPGQTKAFEDNTHFNPYGAYEIAKCVIEGMKKLDLPIIKFLRPDYQAFDPAHPDNRDTFLWNDSPFTEIEKPDGN